MYCLKNPKVTEQIVHYCLDEEVHVQQNAGAVLGKLIDHDKHILDPHLEQIVLNLEKNPHDAVTRATLRVFQWAKIPEAVEGELFEFIINALKSSEEPIAIKAFGMTVARRICEKYPELAQELIPHIELLVEQKASAGLVNRGKKELKKLYALSNC